jgi:PAS domain S-box-containing protein
MADHSPSVKPVSISQGKILAVVLIYATLAATWILLSDRLLNALVRNPEEIVQISIFKGWFYVCITSLLLYALLRHWFYDARNQRQQPVLINNRPLKTALLLLVLVIVIFTMTGITMNYRQHQEDTIAQLQAVANLKTRQIADWLNERKSNAEFVKTSVFFAELYRQWQENQDANSGQTLKLRLQQLAITWGFEGISLIDNHGVLIWQTENAPSKLAPEATHTANSSTTEGVIRRLNPYRDANNRVLLDFVVQLKATDKSSEPPIIVLHINLARWLFPNLDTMSILSHSGETLLFRLQNDQIIYLNNLKHNQNTAANLALPLTTPKLLAAQVLLKQVELGELIEGVDYRNIPVLGVANSIPGTDWYLIAKKDISELVSKAMDDALWVGLVGMLALFVSGVGYFLIIHIQQLSVAEATQKNQAERLQALTLLAAIAESSDDAIFAKDLQERYILFNRAACIYTGKTVEEVIGQDDTALFPKEQAEQLKASGQQVMTERRILSYEEKLNTVDGERIFHVTEGPLLDNQGQLIGIFGIARDISTLKSVVTALSRQSEELLTKNQELERFNRAMIGRELEMIKLKKQINELSILSGQQPPYNLSFLDEALPQGENEIL